jgi:hypothetical protein
MLHTLRFCLQNAIYFIMLLFLFMYYSHFTYRVCQNLNVKFRCQKVKEVLTIGREGKGKLRARTEPGFTRQDPTRHTA